MVSEKVEGLGGDRRRTARSPGYTRDLLRKYKTIPIWKGKIKSLVPKFRMPQHSLLSLDHIFQLDCPI